MFVVSRLALRQLEQRLRQEPNAAGNALLVRQARLLSLRTLSQARVLVPPSPGVKRLQAILYTQLQRAMLGEIGSDSALEQAGREWNAYAAARWP